MRAHFLQHVPFEGLGYIRTWLEGEGAEIAGTRLYAGEDLPALDGIDLVIAMGGPMSVNDEVDLPWLVAEKAFIRQAVEKGIAVLGVCLGAQLIASALGGRVYGNAQKEIGWFPIQATPAEGCFTFPEEAMVLHWHGETFELPPGAVRIASSVACDNQAFQLGERVIGLQFHLEMTPESAEAIIDNCKAELVPARYVHGEDELRGVPVQSYEAGHELLAAILSYLTR